MHQKKRGSLPRFFTIRCLLLLALLVEMELSIKPINASAGIDQLLFAGKERVTLGTDFDADILLCRAGLNHLSTGAGNRSRTVIRMDSFLHDFHLFRNTEIHST